MPRSNLILETAPAKVNLSLRVLGRRADGYHEIESLVMFARSAADQVRFTPGREPKLNLSGPFASALKGTNIVETVLARIFDVVPDIQLGEVSLDKRLPVASGVGGGSADAAAVLRALRVANADLASTVDWVGTAAALGADVPMCLESRACFVRGVGTEVLPLSDFPPLAIVLANSLVEMPSDKTAQVFKRLAAPEYQTGGSDEPRTCFSSRDDLIAYVASVGNDLTGPALSLAPQISDVVRELSASHGCRYAALSGAGPTCFGLYDDLQTAKEAAMVLTARRPDWWVVASELG